MNNLLFDKYPLIINPKLAEKIGLNEAIILQQIHYWIEKNKEKENNYSDNKYWVYNSYKNWKNQFPFWSIPTIKRIIYNLEGKELLISANYNKMKADRTKWYTINYDILDKIGQSLYQNDTTIVSNCTEQRIKMIQPLPETTPEITSETKTINIQKNKKQTFKFKIEQRKVNRKEYAEDIYLNENEYQKLINSYGEEFTKVCIDKLSNAKLSKGYEYISDYRAILNWVVDDRKKNGYTPLQTISKEEQQKKAEKYVKEQCHNSSFAVVYSRGETERRKQEDLNAKNK